MSKTTNKERYETDFYELELFNAEAIRFYSTFDVLIVEKKTKRVPHSRRFNTIYLLTFNGHEEAFTTFNKLNKAAVKIIQEKGMRKNPRKGAESD